MYSIRNHCIPAYDILCRLRRVLEIPQELDNLEEKTAGGIVSKIFTIRNSGYWLNLPESKVIKSGAIRDYLWTKKECAKEIDRITSEYGLINPVG